jgi:hypothetical protein
MNNPTMNISASMGFIPGPARRGVTALVVHRTLLVRGPATGFNILLRNGVGFNEVTVNCP